MVLINYLASYCLNLSSNHNKVKVVIFITVCVCMYVSESVHERGILVH